MNSETACTKARANTVAGISVSAGESNFHAIVCDCAAWAARGDCRHVWQAAALVTMERAIRCKSWPGISVWHDCCIRIRGISVPGCCVSCRGTHLTSDPPSMSGAPRGEKHPAYRSTAAARGKHMRLADIDVRRRRQFEHCERYCVGYERSVRKGCDRAAWRAVSELALSARSGHRWCSNGCGEAAIQCLP